MSDYNWITTTQSNENGTSKGYFDYERDCWVAEVFLKRTGETFTYMNISHKEVAKWLENKQNEYGLR